MSARNGSRPLLRSGHSFFHKVTADGDARRSDEVASGECARPQKPCGGGPRFLLTLRATQPCRCETRAPHTHSTAATQQPAPGMGHRDRITLSGSRRSFHDGVSRSVLQETPVPVTARVVCTSHYTSQQQLIWILVVQQLAWMRSS